MSDETLERFVTQYIAASPGPEVSFVWHGGEPTLAGLDFYRRVVELQARHLPPGWTAWNNLQTNGVLLDDEWCAFLAGHRFDVGVSIDGTRAIHDAGRPDPRGRGSYQAAVTAVRRLQAHGVQPDLLCTVTDATTRAPLAVYRSLRALGTGWLQFIPVLGHVDGEAYGDFLGAIFDEWVYNDLGRTEVQLFAETARLLAGGTAGVCWLAPTCGRALVVEADGSVYSCDHFVNPAHRLGDVATADLGDLARSPRQRAFGDAKRTLPAQCRQCPWLTLCRGGCPKDRLPDGVNHLCGGLTRFYAHAVPRIRRVIGLTRLGHAPAQIMAQLRTEARGR
jgi:uncharacterized protein